MSPRQRKPKPAPKRPRRRDYRAEYARRQAKARAEGFASYYDRRVRAGSLEAPRPKGDTLRRRRGHAAGRDLVDAAREGDLVIAQLNRDRQGRFRSIDVTLIHEDGSEQEFTIRHEQLEADYLRELEDDLADKGVAQSYGYPIRNIIDDLAQTMFGFTRVSARGIVRWLRRFDAVGRAITTADADKALLVASLAAAQDFYDAKLKHLRGRSRFMIEEVTV